VVHAVLLTKSGAAFQSARIDANFELAKYLSEMSIELRSVAGRNTKVGLLGLDSVGTVERRRPAARGTGISVPLYLCTFSFCMGKTRGLWYVPQNSWYRSS